MIPLGSQKTLDAKRDRLRLHLSAVLDIEEPAEVICEALDPLRLTDANQRLTRAVHDVVVDRGLPLRYVLLRDARARLGLASDLAADLANRHPRLRRYTADGRAGGDADDLRRYWSRAFAALAIAVAAYDG